MEAALAALGANLRLHVLDNVEPALEPVLLLDLLRRRLGIAELTFHSRLSFSYRVMVTNGPVSV